MYISAMTNQQLMDNGHQMMDETDQAIERSKKVGIFFIKQYYSAYCLRFIGTISVFGLWFC